MRTLATSTDEELLLANTSDAFGEFYDRHARELMGYFARRARDPQAAADLTAETFASAIVAQRRFRPGGPPAIAWLFTIAARRLADYQRRGWVDERVRRARGLERPPITQDDAPLIAVLAEEVTSDLLAGLPPDQRDAEIAHVVDDRGYPEPATDGSTSEAVVRQRVSRGLATLRRRIGTRP
jgi:RNA polymerase sigma factor (sigma-70 family)